MACSCITLENIGKECRNSTGGIKDVWIIDANNITGVELETGSTSLNRIVSISVASGATFAHWEFRPETASLTSTGTMDNAAGTYYVQNDLALQFSKMEAQKRLQIQGASMCDTKVVVRDNNKKLFYLGFDNDVYASALTGNSGTALGDLNGYNITLTDIASELPHQIEMDAESLAAIGIVL